jgi:hypothetical protein
MGWVFSCYRKLFEIEKISITFFWKTQSGEKVMEEKKSITFLFSSGKSTVG